MARRGPSARPSVKPCWKTCAASWLHREMTGTVEVDETFVGGKIEGWGMGFKEE